jgi:hypothetical protein
MKGGVFVLMRSIIMRLLLSFSFMQKEMIVTVFPSHSMHWLTNAKASKCSISIDLLILNNIKAKITFKCDRKAFQDCNFYPFSPKKDIRKYRFAILRLISYNDYLSRYSSFKKTELHHYIIFLINKDMGITRMCYSIHQKDQSKSRLWRN